MAPRQTGVSLVKGCRLHLQKREIKSNNMQVLSVRDHDEIEDHEQSKANENKRNNQRH